MNPEILIEIFRKISKKALFPLGLLLYSIILIFVAYTAGMKAVDGERQNITALNASTTANSVKNSGGALSVSDPLFLVKLTTQCPQLPPELLEMALMFVETPSSRKAVDRLNNYTKPKPSTGDDWIKQAPSPFAQPANE